MEKKKRKFRMPHTYVIIFGIVVLSMILANIVPAGEFERVVDEMGNTVVVADSRYPADGRFIEKVGTYNPMKNPIEFTLKEEEVKKWISNGAQTTDAVNRLLVKAGIN